MVHMFFTQTIHFKTHLKLSVTYIDAERIFPHVSKNFYSLWPFFDKFSVQVQLVELEPPLLDLENLDFYLFLARKFLANTLLIGWPRLRWIGESFVTLFMHNQGVDSFEIWTFQLPAGVWNFYFRKSDSSSYEPVLTHEFLTQVALVQDWNENFLSWYKNRPIFIKNSIFCYFLC